MTFGPKPIDFRMFFLGGVQAHDFLSKTYRFEDVLGVQAHDFRSKSYQS